MEQMLEAETVLFNGSKELKNSESSWIREKPQDVLIVVSDVNSIRVSRQEIRSGIGLLAGKSHVDTVWLDLGNQAVIDWLGFKRVLAYFSRHLHPFLDGISNVGFCGLAFLLPGNKEGHLSVEFLDDILPETFKKKGKWMGVPLTPLLSGYYLQEKHFIKSQPFQALDAFQRLGYEIQGEIDDSSDGNTGFHALLDDLQGDTPAEKYMSFVELFPQVSRIRTSAACYHRNPFPTRDSCGGDLHQFDSNGKTVAASVFPKPSASFNQNQISRILKEVIEKGFLNELEIVELVMVLAGEKKVMRTTITPHCYQELSQFLSANGIPYKCDRVSLRYRKDKGKGGWSNLYEPNGLSHQPYREFMIYIGLSNLAVQRAYGNEKESDDLFGEILSYPECCRVAFERNLPIASKKQGDLVPLVADQTIDEGPWSFLLNTAARYFMKNLISFYPCSYTCKKAKNISKRYFRILQTYLPDYAQELEYIMGSPVLYTEYMGIYLFPAAKSDDNLLHYDPEKLLMTTQNSLGKSIYQGSTLSINQSDSIDIVCGRDTIRTIQGDNVRMLLFHGEM